MPLLDKEPRYNRLLLSSPVNADRRSLPREPAKMHGQRSDTAVWRSRVLALAARHDPLNNPTGSGPLFDAHFPRHPDFVAQWLRNWHRMAPALWNQPHAVVLNGRKGQSPTTTITTTPSPIPREPDIWWQDEKVEMVHPSVQFCVDVMSKKS